MPSFDELTTELYLSAKKEGLPSTILTWLDSSYTKPVHYVHGDHTYSHEQRKGDGPVEVSLNILPEVLIEGGYIVTFHDWCNPTIAKREGNFTVNTLSPKTWIDFSREVLGDFALMITVTAMAIPRKDPGDRYTNWELDPESVKVTTTKL